jgi:hypothetical protein
MTKRQAIVLIVAGLIALCTSLFILMWKSPYEPKIRLTEEDLLIMTELAFLKGYKSGMLQEKRDTVWTNLEKEYKGLFE